MKNLKLYLSAAACVAALCATAQDNHYYGETSEGEKSLADEVMQLKKDHDKINIYFNTAFALRGETNSEYDDDDNLRFTNRQLRFEVKGNLTDQLYYRFRHRFNVSSAGASWDNFARATDYMMVGYRVCDKLEIQAGKMGQIWGGYEFDENPIHIYQYSDFCSNMDDYSAGVGLSYFASDNHSFAFELCNAYTGTFAEEYGDDAKLINGNDIEDLKRSKTPLMAIFGWNGSFLDGVLQTRWSYGMIKQAEDKMSHMALLGQQFKQGNITWYLDYMMAIEGVDRMRVATYDVIDIIPLHNSSAKGEYWLSNVHYNSLVTKFRWQMTDKWHLMLKGTYEMVSVPDISVIDDYRTSAMFLGAIEYHPLMTDDLYLYGSILSHHTDWDCDLASASNNFMRFEVGMVWRIKAF